MFRRSALRRVLIAAGVAGLLALTASTALAGGNGATSSTQTFHGVETFPVSPICGAPSGTLTGTFNQVTHTTVNKADDVWFTSREEAWFTIVPDDPSLPNFAGHFAIGFGGSLNANNSVLHDTFNAKATATDGSGATVAVHLVDHMSVSASGQVIIFSSCH